MEKTLSAVGYWLGMACTALALICRVIIAIDVVPPRIGAADGLAISYFFYGAALLFLLSIASWWRSAKP